MKLKSNNESRRRTYKKRKQDEETHSSSRKEDLIQSRSHYPQGSKNKYRKAMRYSLKAVNPALIENLSQAQGENDALKEVIEDLKSVDSAIIETGNLISFDETVKQPVNIIDATSGPNTTTYYESPNRILDTTFRDVLLRLGILTPGKLELDKPNVIGVASIPGLKRTLDKSTEVIDAGLMAYLEVNAHTDYKTRKEKLEHFKNLSRKYIADERPDLKRSRQVNYTISRTADDNTTNVLFDEFSTAGSIFDNLNLSPQVLAENRQLLGTSVSPKILQPLNTSQLPLGKRLFSIPSLMAKVAIVAGVTHIVYTTTRILLNR